MDLGISGRTAAVAAGSAGLGLGAAKALAAEGVRVAICGRDAAKLSEAATAIGGEVITLEADLSTPSSGREFVEQATADGAGPALASMLVYILMAVVLIFRPTGLFPAKG